MGGVDPKEAQRLARKQRRQEERRGRILDAARQVLAEHGAEALTIAAVAEAADVSPPSLYYYYSDKDALNDALIADAVEEEVEMALAAIDGITDGVEALEAYLRARVAFYLERPAAYELFFSTMIQGASTELLAEVVYPASRRINERLEALLVADQQAGRVHPEVSARKLTNIAFCTAGGILELALGMARAGGALRFSVDELVDEACAHLRRGCRP